MSSHNDPFATYFRWIAIDNTEKSFARRAKSLELPLSDGRLWFSNSFPQLEQFLVQFERFDGRKRSGSSIGTKDDGVAALSLMWQEARGLHHTKIRMARASVVHEAAEDAQRAAAKKPAPKPAAPAITPLPKEGDIDIEAELQRDLKRAADEARAIEQLKAYQGNPESGGGIEDSEANAHFMRDFVQAEAKGYWSREIIDVAIQRLGPRGTNQLTWRKIKRPAAPTPPEPVEQLGTLPDGSQQLPLDVQPTKHHTTDQIEDWLKRTREATGLQFIGPGKSQNRVATRF